MLIRHYPFTARITAIKSSRPRYDLCVMEATTRMFDDVKFRSANNNDNHKVKTLTYSGEADLWSRNHDVIKPALRKNEAVKLYYSESPENDDEDDDVFAPEDPEDGLSKPLMYPRQRTKVKTVRPSGRAGKVLRCAACIGLSVSMVVAAAWLIAYVHSHKKHLFQSQNISAVTGCSHIDTEDVWIMKLPKLTTESAIRMMDVNNDKVLDVILGFATGANGYSGTENLCDVYFNGTQLCQGGLLALDGRSGEEIWRHYMDNEIFALNCDEDLNTDGLNECLTSGRHGTLEAVNMKAGSTLWTFDQKENKEVRVDVMNIYTALYVMDLDGDGVADIVIMHGGDPLAKPGQSDRLAGRLLVLSGQTGHVLQWVETPDGRESYYSPVMTIRRDGTPMILFGTGGETNGGALWHITLGDLYKGDIRKARTIYTDAFKGVMTPPALVDITGDGVCDIVFASFNSTVVAIDGDTYKLLWSFSYPSSETYMTPAPGFYNDDDTPDFLIHYQYGPGYPVYYHAITTVLDGRSGKPLVKPYIHSTTGTQVSPLTVSTAGVGNDVFLHWMDDCMGHEGEGTPYSFLEGTNEHIKSHADLCQLRFDSSAVNRLYAHGQHFMPPGVPIYDSAERITMETAGWVDTAAEGENFLRAHPGLQGAAEASHQMQDPQHSAATQQSAATARRQFFRNHPGVTGRKHLPRFRDWPAKSRAKMQEPQLETSRKLQHEYHQPNWKYKQPDRNQDYFSHHGNTQSQQRLEEDAYPQLAGLASNFGGQNYYGRNKPAAGQQGFKPQSVLDERYGVQKRNFNGDRREGVQGERDTRKRGKRKKRDAGTSGAGTVQKSLSTGTLAPSSLPPTHPDYHHSIDVVFATYRFHPSDAVVILPSDQPCIDQILATRPFRFDPTDGLDVEAYRQRVIRTCLERRGKGSVNINLHPSQSDPYHAQMGQTVVYRIRLKCTCEMRNSTSDQETCGQVLPYDQQAWSAYMGSSGTGHWHPPPPPVQ